VPRPTRHSPFARNVFLTLAALALALKALLPAGFMVDSAARGFPLVICTSQGTTVVHQDGAPADPASKAQHDAPCAFAGHGAGAIPPSLTAPVAAAYAAYVAASPATPASPAPGRGLAAPPLPARGPPTLTV
jgi:hypothetical protein